MLCPQYGPFLGYDSWLVAIDYIRLFPWRGQHFFLMELDSFFRFALSSLPADFSQHLDLWTGRMFLS